jgi:hypothetical protein
MHGHGQGLPHAREGLLSEWVDDEVVVLDGDSGQAHCLSGPAAAIWDHCDGTNDVAGLARHSGQPAEAVRAALHELTRLGLLGGTDPEARGLTRRGVAQRAAQTGIGVLVLSAALPSVASAASKTANCQTAPSCTATSTTPVADVNCASGFCAKTPTTGTLVCVRASCVAANGACTGKTCCFGTCTLTRCPTTGTCNA